MAGEHASRIWWRACVVRAQTVAADIRLVDLAVEPAYPEFEPGEALDVIVEDAGVTSIHSHVSMPIGPGLLRISVQRAPATRHGVRFLWSLVEGATITFTAPGRAPAKRRVPHANRLVANDIRPVARLIDMRRERQGPAANLTP